ncbi:MAG: hypothetical protein ACYC6C_12645, partial [Coriobacteriia bacterium]
TKLDLIGTMTVQRGSSAITTASYIGALDITISAVDMAKTWVRAASASTNVNAVSSKLTTATNLNISVHTNTAAQATTLDWEVIQIA